MPLEVQRRIDEPLELYNLDTDLAEEQNIANQHPDVVAHINQFMKNTRTDSPNWPIGVKNSHG